MRNKIHKFSIYNFHWMLELHFGKDTYSAKSKLKSIKKGHIEKYGEINLITFDGSKIDNLKDISNEICTLSFFSEKKLIIVENFLSQNKKNELKKKYIELLKKTEIEKNKDYTLIHFENTDEIDKRQSLYKYIKKIGTIKEYRAPDHNVAYYFIEENLKNNNIEYTKESIEAILENSPETDLFVLTSEIEKLTLFIQYNKLSKLDINIVDKVITKNSHAKVFDLLDSIAEKKEQRAIHILKTLLSLGENEFSLLGMLSYQIRTFITLKLLLEKGLQDNEIIQQSKLHPFVVRKNKNTVRKFSYTKLTQILQYILKIEHTIKSKETSPSLLLTQFIHFATT